MFAVFCAANIVGAHFLKNTLDFPTDTKFFYSPAAENLLAGKGYTVEGVFADRYPPGYPFFLSAVYALSGQAGENNFLYPYIIALLQAASCILLYKTAKMLTSPSQAVMTAALFLSYPFFAVLSMTRYAWTAMPLFIFVFYAALYLFFKTKMKKKLPGGFFLSGLLFGVSALVWPASVGLWLLFALYLFFSGAPRAVSSFILGVFLPILIWCAVVSANTGHFRLSSGGWPSVKDGLVHSSGTQMARFDFSGEALKEIEDGNMRGPLDAAAFTLRKLRTDFKDTSSYLVFKIFRPWYATDSEKFEKIILAAQVPYLLLSIFGFLNLREENKKEGRLLLGAVIYFWITAFSVLSILRYMIPAMGLLMVFAPAGGEFIRKRIFQNEK